MLFCSTRSDCSEKENSHSIPPLYLHCVDLLSYIPLQALSSLDDDDPNILLAIQLSLQESGLSVDEETRQFLNNESSLGAIGSSLPTRLDPSPISLEHPRSALSSSELLELGESLVRLGASNDPYAIDRIHSNSFTDVPTSSSDLDSSSQDPNMNENLLGNIMAWFHDINPQSIALIPSMASETDVDLQPLSTSDQLLPPLALNMAEEHALFQDALINEDPETRTEEIASEQMESQAEAVSQSDDHTNEVMSSVASSEDISSRTPEPPTEWVEQVHLV